MTRTARISLADVWHSGEARSQLAAEVVGLKLPILPSEYPTRHEMRQLSHGRSLPIGACGPLEIWLAGCYIIFLHHLREGEVFSGIQYVSAHQAAKAFASMFAFNDEQGESRRGYPLKFYGGEPVTVVDFERDSLNAKSLVDDVYCRHRRYAIKGRVLCRVRWDRDDFWLVEHEGTVAAYYQYELMLSGEEPMPAVVSFTVDGLGRNCLCVRFEDGCEAVIVKNSGGFGESNAIETFKLERDGRWVVQYQSPYQHPRNTSSSNGFVQLDSGYTTARVAEYWVAADGYVRNLVKEAGGQRRLLADSGDLYWAFRILADGQNDLADVHRGRAEVHC